MINSSLKTVKPLNRSKKISVVSEGDLSHSEAKIHFFEVKPTTDICQNISCHRLSTES